MKTLTAQRDCISAIGGTGPFTRTAPIIARVPGFNIGGNTYLKRGICVSFGCRSVSDKIGKLNLYPVPKIIASMQSSLEPSVN